MSEHRIRLDPLKKLDETEILANWHEGKPIGPWKLDLRPTDKCNLKCKPCWLRAFDGQHMQYEKELSKEEILRVIEEAAELGVQTVEIVGGGEPLFEPDTALSYLLAIKQFGMHGDLTTNGTRFTPEIISSLVSAGWDNIVFSIDAPDAQTHDYVRGVPGAFDKSLQAIKDFAAEKKKQGLEKPTICITSIMTKRLAGKFADFVRLATENGVAKLIFKPMYVHAEVAKPLLPAEADRKRMYEEIPKTIELAEKLGVWTNLSEIIDDVRVVEKSDDIVKAYAGPEKEGQEGQEKVGAMQQSASPRMRSFVDTPCFQPWYYMAVDSHGFVQPCAGTGKHYKVENLREKSLREIWFSQSFLRYRGWVHTGDLPDYCKECCGGIYLDNKRIRENLVRLINHA